MISARLAKCEQNAAVSLPATSRTRGGKLSAAHCRNSTAHCKATQPQACINGDTPGVIVALEGFTVPSQSSESITTKQHHRVVTCSLVQDHPGETFLLHSEGTNLAVLIRLPAGSVHATFNVTTSSTWWCPHTTQQHSCLARLSTLGKLRARKPPCLPESIKLSLVFPAPGTKLSEALMNSKPSSHSTASADA